MTDDGSFFQSLRLRSRGELVFHTGHDYGDAPMVEVRVTARFVAPSAGTHAIEAFHDGDGTWRVRFNPGEVGIWSWAVRSVPPNPDFEREGSFQVTPAGSALQERGFLRSTPGEAWGFQYEDGEPVFVFGDTPSIISSRWRIWVTTPSRRWRHSSNDAPRKVSTCSGSASR